MVEATASILRLLQFTNQPSQYKISLCDHFPFIYPFHLILVEKFLPTCNSTVFLKFCPLGEVTPKVVKCLLNVNNFDILQFEFLALQKKKEKKQCSDNCV